MSVAAYLLGAPVVVRDGTVYAAPKGRKAWALLAYLALSDRAPTRQQLIDFLFPDAEDPAGALRWNLSELRRLLGGPDTVGSGSVVRLRLPEGSFLDVQVLMAGTSFESVELPGLGKELLEGVEIEASPGFAAWLLGERRRLAGLGEAVLREGALRALASGNARTAVDLATRLVAAAPLDEDAHALLIRAFAGSGDTIAVERQLAASIDLFRRELGVEPGPELAEAARMDAPAARTDAGGRLAALRALLESGEAAVSAGAVQAGVDSLRSAVAGSRASGDRALEAAALLSLGAALVHQTKQEAWSTAMLGRTHLLRDELEPAEAALERAIALTAAERWTTFAAFPEALLAEVWVRGGDLGRATEAFEHAFALGCQVDDACWEAYGVRGLGLLEAASGDLAGAVKTIGDAVTRCARQRDTHLWLRAYVMG